MSTVFWDFFKVFSKKENPAFLRGLRIFRKLKSQYTRDLTPGKYLS